MVETYKKIHFDHKDVKIGRFDGDKGVACCKKATSYIKFYKSGTIRLCIT